ncbi:hypothetical protein AVEN_185287-1 [Araneus ventricosus]|uniref:Uncharacterized protein n=1 Tax=Araneus ventricosus TaxID=182803 RepID=A0A4Y2KVI6_ARAVE|nr:hypothetical protein AVEN_185287-1 [Araneus ventricosus]
MAPLKLAPGHQYPLAPRSLLHYRTAQCGQVQCALTVFSCWSRFPSQLHGKTKDRRCDRAKAPFCVSTDCGSCHSNRCDAGERRRGCRAAEFPR